jgi:cytochrome c553
MHELARALARAAAVAGVAAAAIAAAAASPDPHDPHDGPAGAASCSGCHPASETVDTPVPRIAGRDPQAIAAALRAFRSGQRPATIMDRIARGFDDAEIQALAAWFGAQR